MVSVFGIVAILGRTLSAEEFGAWTVLLSLLNLVASLDLGVTGGTRVRLIKLVSKGNLGGANRTYVWSMTILSIFIFFVATSSALLIPLPRLLGFPETGAFNIAAWSTYFIALATIPLGLASNLFISYFESATVAFLELLRTTLQTGAVGFAVYAGYSFNSIVLLYFSAYLFVCIYGFILFQTRRAASLSVVWYLWNRRPHNIMLWIRILLSKAIALSIIFLALSLTSNLGAIVISRFVSVSNASEYGILSRLFTAALGLHLAFLMPYMAGFGQRYHQADYAWCRKTLAIFILGTLTIVVVGAPIMLIYGPRLIEMWSGYSITNLYLYTGFLVTTLFAAVFQILWYFLQGIGKIKAQMYLAIIVIIGNLFATIAGAKLYGATGVIFATSAIMAAWVGVTAIQVKTILANRSIAHTHLI